ncbi:GNAT family N-acetyltransferase [Streptomyces collinus]|uniref:GNAT family N-acetyltransferase n=1 Tax=Streptomyces collinus TaxID=42684 RepID=UPI00331DCE12
MVQTVPAGGGGQQVDYNHAKEVVQPCDQSKRGSGGAPCTRRPGDLVGAVQIGPDRWMQDRLIGTHIRRALVERVSSIGTIAVHPDHRGQGIAPAASRTVSKPAVAGLLT